MKAILISLLTHERLIIRFITAWLIGTTILFAAWFISPGRRLYVAHEERGAVSRRNGQMIQYVLEHSLADPAKQEDNNDGNFS